MPRIIARNGRDGGMTSCRNHTHKNEHNIPIRQTTRPCDNISNQWEWKYRKRSSGYNTSNEISQRTKRFVFFCVIVSVQRHEMQITSRRSTSINNSLRITVHKSTSGEFMVSDVWPTRDQTCTHHFEHRTIIFAHTKLLRIKNGRSNEH